MAGALRCVVRPRYRGRAVGSPEPARSALRLRGKVPQAVAVVSREVHACLRQIPRKERATCLAARPFYAHTERMRGPSTPSAEQPRAWRVLLSFDRSDVPEVQLAVDGRELLPRRSMKSPIEALEYIDEALIDFRRGDQVTLVARRKLLVTTATTRVRALALHWCANVLQIAWFETNLVAPVDRSTSPHAPLRIRRAIA
jgi:hypothetical protein